MHQRQISAVAAVLSWSISLIAHAVPATQPARGAAGPATGRTVLRLATSDDGLVFSDAADPFKVQGSSPDLVRLPNGRLLAIFQSPSGNSPEGTILLVACSRDEGRSWSEPRRAIIRDRAGNVPRVDLPTLCALRDGSLRLYCRVQTDRGVAIGSASSRDGLNYEWDSDFRVPANVSDGLRPQVVVVGRRSVLLLTSSEADPASRDEALQLLSTNGRRFYKPARRFAPPGTLRLIPLRGGEARAFVAVEGGVHALTGDGARWRDEGMTRIPSHDFAVVALESGKYLMLYSRRARADEVVKQTPAAAEDGTASSDDWSAIGASLGDLEQTPLPPAPDFQTEFDYLGWLQQNVPSVPGEENAYDAYAAFMPRPGDNSANKVPEKIDDMLNGDNAGQPGPWDPTQHPNWEATHQSIQPLLEQFRQACQLDTYSMPLEFTPEQYAKAPGGRPFIFEMLLPTLGPHRRLVRAELADGWRAEGGQVSPERMIQSWETTLRAAHHVDQAPFLINRLVAKAEEAMTYDNARRALQTGAFSAEQLQAALRTLQDHAQPTEDPAGWVTSEAAGFMEAWQRLCMPQQPGEPWKLNPKVLQDLQVMSSDLPAGFEQLTPERIQIGLQQSAEFFREAARQSRIGYPTIRGADLKATQDKYIPNNATSIFLPSISRPYVLQARCEANRRATQLTYALHLYRAQAGRWPNTLDELPADWGETMKTDPFTGRQFQYRITPTGPTLYSLSENGVDDGGVHSRRWDDSKDENGGSDDFVFWPVQP